MSLPKVSYGDTDAESIDWRKKLGRNKPEDDDVDDDNDQLTPEEKQELIDMIGFDPDELDQEEDKKQLPPPPSKSFTE